MNINKYKVFYIYVYIVIRATMSRHDKIFRGSCKIYSSNYCSGVLLKLKSGTARITTQIVSNILRDRFSFASK